MNVNMGGSGRTDGRMREDRIGVLSMVGTEAPVFEAFADVQVVVN